MAWRVGDRVRAGPGLGDSRRAIPEGEPGDGGGVASAAGWSGGPSGADPVSSGGDGAAGRKVTAQENIGGPERTHGFALAARRRVHPEPVRRKLRKLVHPVNTGGMGGHPPLAGAFGGSCQMPDPRFQMTWPLETGDSE